MNKSRQTARLSSVSNFDQSGKLTDIKLGDKTFTEDKILDFNLTIAPEVLEIQVDAPQASQDVAWLWTWLTSSLPYARTTITNSPQISVPLYKKGAYVLNNFAANDLHDNMTQIHKLYLKWIDGAGTQNNVSWSTAVESVSYTHPNINGGLATNVQRLTINVPENVTLPTLVPPTVSYNVSFTTPGSYYFTGAAYGQNPNLGPFYRGGTYTFNLDASLAGHPFYLTTDNGANFVSGAYFGEYTTGVTGSRNTSGTLTFTVPANAPDTLYYQCGAHGSMRGAITIKNLAVEVNNNGNYVLYFQHTQEGHKTPVEIRPIPSLVNQMCLVYDATAGKFVPQDLATYVENTPSFKNKIQEVAGTATLVAPDGIPVVATVSLIEDASYLPLVGNKRGDIAYTEDTNTLNIWNGSVWESTKPLDTNALPEGSTNKYYTDARVGTYLGANGYATQSYVGTQIANLVNSAPTTLNTLNELATALGNDPNFATTITTSIGTKVPLARTITINGTAYDLSADRSWTIAAGLTSFNTRTGAITLTSGDVTGALGFTPYNSTNPSGYITGITSSMVTTALGYTPYNSSNPSGYITASGSITGSAGSATYSNLVYIGGSSSKAIKDDAWAGAGGYPGYSFTGGNSRFGFSSTSGYIDVYTDGNFYAGIDLNGSNNLVLHTGNYSSYALPLSGGTLTGAVTWNDSTYFKGSPTHGFRFNNSADTINAMIINNSGDVTAYSSMRAPIFYDSNDTGYYGDFAGTSSLWGLAIRGDNGASSNNNQLFFWGTGGTTTSAIGFKSNAGSFGNPTGYGDGYNTYLTMDTPGRGWVFRRGVGGTDFSAAYTAGWILNNGVAQFNDSVRAPIFYDSADTTYYLDPAGNGTRAGYFNGNIWINPKSESYGEGIAFLMPNQNTWGGLRWTRSTTNFTGAWAFGYFGNEANNDIGFHNGTNGWRLDHSFNMTVNGSVRSPIFYDSADTSYYCDPNSTSRLHTVSSFYLRNNYDVSADHAFGVYFNNSTDQSYAIFRENGGWGHPYPDLRIAFHTGIKLGAYFGYNGTRFYNNSDMATITASVNDGDNNFRGYYDIIAYASDRRLKHKVTPITNAVSKVMSLTGMTYEWNNVAAKHGWEPGNEREAGVFAQDVQAVLPEAVRPAPFDHAHDENGATYSKSGENFLTVKYEKLVPLLIEGMKEQQAQIISQGAQITELMEIIKTMKGL